MNDVRDHHQVQQGNVPGGGVVRSAEDRPSLTEAVGTLGAAGVSAHDSERGPKELRFLVGGFLCFSILLCLTVPSAGLSAVKIVRWIFLGLAATGALRYSLSLPLSWQGLAWLASALYAGGTVLYSIDVPSTVLRSVTFAAETLGVFVGASVYYRTRLSAPHRLPGRIAMLLLSLALPSLAGYVAGYPSSFFHRGGLLHGLFGHSNTLGAFGAMWLVVGIGALDTRLAQHRKLALVGVLAMALCLFASKSRAGVSGTAVSLLLYVLLTRQLQRVALLATLSATVVLSAYLFLPSVVDVISEEGSEFVHKGGVDDPLASRRDTLDISRENILASPWLGYGFGTSVGEETKEWRLFDLGAREKGNALLAILEETGTIGTLVMGFPVLLCILSGLRVKRLNTYLASRPHELRTDARLAAAFWAGAMGGLANNMAEATLWSAGSPHGGMLLFLAAASEGLLSRTEERL